MYGYNNNKIRLTSAFKILRNVKLNYAEIIIRIRKNIRWLK